MIKKLLIILISLLPGQVFTVQAQDSQNESLYNPYQAIYMHMHFLGEDNYDEKKAAIPFRIGAKTEQEAIESAIKLKQLLDGYGIYIDLDELPRANNYFDSAENKHMYVLDEKFPEIKLIRQKEKWIYPKASILAIKKYHKEFFKFGTDKLVVILPKLGSNNFFGLYLYQYISLLLLIFIAVILQKLLSFLSNRLLLRIVAKAGYEHLAKGYLLPIARPISMLVIVFLIRLFIPPLQLPVLMSHYILIVLNVLLPIFTSVILYRSANILALYLERMAKKTSNTLDDQLVPLIRKTLKTFVVVIGTLLVLSNLKVDIIPLLTGLSIGGLAFALAAQDTIKNFFGSLMIFIDKPFQIGDWITAGEIDGSVEEVGFRSSRIRTFRNSLMYVPNSKLADAVVDNHGLRKYRRFYTQIAVNYDTPPELIEIFVVGLKKIVENHPDTRKDYYNVYFNDMASYSLNIMFYIFFEVPDWPAELKARHEILLSIIKLAKSLEINFAFPTQTLHMENFPGKDSLSPEYMSSLEADAKLKMYFKEK